MQVLLPQIPKGDLDVLIAISPCHQSLSFQYAPAAFSIRSFTLYLTGSNHMLDSSCHRCTADTALLCDILIRGSWNTAYDILHSLLNSIIYSLIFSIIYSIIFSIIHSLICPVSGIILIW